MTMYSARSAYHNALRPPVFLVGSERSGTTMLALMLESHPDIAWGGEMQYLVDYMPKRGEQDLAQVHRSLRLDRGFRLRDLTIDESLDFGALARHLLLQRTNSESEISGATVHKRFDRLLEIWPDAKFIHLVRDPRDVVRSVIGMGWAGNTWVAADTWLEAEILWNRIRSTLASDRYIDIHFESLVRDPHESLGRLCSFLSIEYDPSMLSYPERTTYSAPDPRIAQTWKKKASKSEIRLVEARIGSMLEDRGYRHSGLPAEKVGALRKLWLRQQNRLRKFLARIRLYGGSCVIAEFLARRFGAREIHRRLILRQHEIMNAGLK